jgi:hypothetical protein
MADARGGLLEAIRKGVSRRSFVFDFQKRAMMLICALVHSPCHRLQST